MDSKLCKDQLGRCTHRGVLQLASWLCHTGANHLFPSYVCQHLLQFHSVFLFQMLLLPSDNPFMLIDTISTPEAFCLTKTWHNHLALSLPQQMMITPGCTQNTSAES